MSSVHPVPAGSSRRRVPGLWQGVLWAFQRGGDGGGISRARLVWRALVASLMHGEPLRRWMAVACEQHSRGLITDLEGEYLRAVRPYVHRHTDVALRVSTAQPEQFTQLPELHPQKLGRRQQEPARRGFRPPPSGADALYADYDRRFPRAQPFGTQLFDDSTYQGHAPPPPPASVEASTTIMKVCFMRSAYAAGPVRWNRRCGADCPAADHAAISRVSSVSMTARDAMQTFVATLLREALEKLATTTN